MHPAIEGGESGRMFAWAVNKIQRMIMCSDSSDPRYVARDMRSYDTSIKSLARGYRRVNDHPSNDHHYLVA